MSMDFNSGLDQDKSFEEQLPIEDPILKQKIHSEANLGFMDQYVQEMGQREDLVGVQKFLNFQHDERWQVRFYIARRLRELIRHSNPKIQLLARSVLKHYTTDGESVVRLFAIETLRLDKT